MFGLKHSTLLYQPADAGRSPSSARLWEDSALVAPCRFGRTNHLLEVPADILDAVDPIFYADPLTAALKAYRLH